MLPLLLAFLACASTSDDTGEGDCLDNGTPEAECVSLFTGGGFGFTGTCVTADSALTIDQEGCALTFSYDEPQDGSFPAGATVVGDQVTVDDSSALAGCTGQVYAECTDTYRMTYIEGTCDDGCTFRLSR